MATFQLSNFSGRLTRKKFGTMNSGSARLGKTHSVDPFSDPEALIFNELPVNLDPTHATILDVVIDSVLNEESGTEYCYCIDRSGNVYKINTSTDAISLVVTGVTLGITLKYGGGMKIWSFGGTSKLLIAHDVGALYMNTDGTGVNYLANGMNWGGDQTKISTSTDKIDSSSLPTSPNSANNFQSLWTGMPVQWNAAVGSVTPLVNGTTYYIIVQENFFVKLATSSANALAGIAIDITVVDASVTWTLTTPTGGTGGAGGNWIPNIPHPISDEFFGGIFIGNGFNLVDVNLSAISMKSSRLSPTIPKNYTINTLEVDGQGRYMRVGSTTGTFEDIATQDPTSMGQAPLARTVYWNGIDNGYDSFEPFSQTNTTASFSFVGGDVMLGQDFYGAGLFMNGGGTMQKVEAMQQIRPPVPGAVTSAGSLLLFGAPYYVQGAWLAGLFGYGMLDTEDQAALYPLLGVTPTANNTICTAVGMVRLVQNRYVKSDGTVLLNSKGYISTYETGGTAKGNLYRFSLTPNGGTPNTGVYETLVEKTPGAQQFDYVNIYCAPTQSGVSFKVEVVDVDGTIPTGASFTYTYAAGADPSNPDPTQLQGPLEIIEWKPDMKIVQGMGIRVTNLGTVQPYIYQVYATTHDAVKETSSAQ